MSNKNANTANAEATTNTAEANETRANTASLPGPGEILMVDSQGHQSVVPAASLEKRWWQKGYFAAATGVGIAAIAGGLGYYAGNKVGQRKLTEAMNQAAAEVAGDPLTA